MKNVQIDLGETHSFSDTFLAYVDQNDALKEFYGEFCSPENIPNQIKKKEFPQENRDTLHKVLQVQYKSLTPGKRVKDNIDALKKKNTFTIVTGHQLNLFTGPLYVIYKLVAIIKACEQLNAQYPEYHFVPVYWMASEDHDFEEINHFYFNGKKIQWESEQTGAVGRFSTSELQPVIKKLAAFPDFLLEAYRSNKSLAAAVRQYMDHLFGPRGLVVLDPDDRDLKSIFKPVMEEDIFKHSTQPLVDKISARMEEKGFKTQINARPCNFFYLTDTQRIRLEQEEDVFRLADTDKTFSKNDIQQIIDERPEELSPNVILRPLYQEMILPNLAYCGGPSELVYWLQLKPVFEHYKISFPILLPRNFALILSAQIQRKWDKTGLNIKDLFDDRHSLIKRRTLEVTNKDLHLNGQIEAAGKLFSSIQKQAEAIDPTLGPHVEAQWARTKSRLDRIEKKFIRAEKKHHEDSIRQIEEVLDELFPNGGLQERQVNFLEFYQTDPEFISRLFENFDPFDLRLNVLTYGG